MGPPPPYEADQDLPNTESNPFLAVIPKLTIITCVLELICLQPLLAEALTAELPFDIRSVTGITDDVVEAAGISKLSATRKQIELLEALCEAKCACVDTKYHYEILWLDNNTRATATLEAVTKDLNKSLDKKKHDLEVLQEEFATLQASTDDHNAELKRVED